MELRKPSRQWLAAGTSLVLVVLGVGLYYFLRIRNNRAYLETRNFRVLAIAGRQVGGAIRSIQDMLRSDAHQAVMDVRAQRWKAQPTDPCLPIDDVTETCANGSFCADTAAALRRRLGLRQCLVNQETGTWRPLPGIDFEHYEVAAQQAASDEDQKVEIEEGGGLDLSHQASYSGDHDRRLQTVRVTTRARAQLSALLEPFLVPGVFESYLLLDDTGQVLLALPTDLQVRQLPPSPPAEARAARSGTADSAGRGGTAGTGTPAERTRLPWVQDRDIGGRPYRVFAEPLDLGPTVSTKVAAICGLVPQGRFEADSVALNPYWLVALTALLALAWLAWPLLKVAFMGPTERVRAFDLVFLGFSLLLGAALLTLLSLDVAGYLGEREPMVVDAEAARVAAGGAATVDLQLAGLASSLQQGFKSELDDALVSLAALSPLAEENPSLVVRDLYEPRPGTFGKGWPVGAPLDIRYPIFQTVAWIGPEGEQRVKWSTDPVPAPTLRVDDRDYFLNAKNDRLWSHPRARRFYAEPVRSRSTGEPLLILSTSARVPTRDGRGLEGGAFALAMRAYSLISTVLPPGFGFAVVSPEGRTLLHSDTEHAIEENFFEESDQHPGLRAAVFSGTVATLDAKYWGRDYRLHVSPLEGVPWSLVVFYAKDLLRTLHLEILTLSFALCLVLLVSLALYAALARFLVGGGRRPWLWPRPGSAHRYLALAALLLLTSVPILVVGARHPSAVLPFAASAVAVVAAQLAPSAPSRWRRPVAGALVPLPLVVLLAYAGWNKWSTGLTLTVALGAGFIALAYRELARRPRALAGAWSERSHANRRAYLAWVASALVCFGAAPAFAFFRYAWDREMNLYLRYAQLEIARGLDGHRLAQAPSKAGSSPECLVETLPDGRVRACGLKNATAYPFVHVRAFFGTEVVEPASAQACPEGSSPSDPVSDALAESLVPLFNEHSVRLRRLDKGGATDREWCGQRTASAPLSLTMLGPASGNTYHLRSRAPRFSGLLTLTAFAGFAGTTLGALLLLRFLARRFFLLDFKDPETISLRDLAILQVRTNLFIVCPPMARKELVLSRRDLLVVDLVGSKLTPSDLEALLRDHPHPRALCFDRFEVALQDEGARHLLLAGLEAAVSMPGPPIFILSETEPEPALGLERVNSASPATADPELRRRWAQVLGRFARVVAVDPGEEEQFEAEVDRAEKQALALARSPHHERRLRENFATLRHECRAHHQLQIIGLTLLELSDLRDYDRDRLVRHIRELADSFYRALWLSLSAQEKLLLAQVAAGDLVNPRAGRALSRLLAEGLLVRDPTFRVRNVSLARFVSAAATRTEVAAWERSGTVSLWAEMRAPVLIALLGAAGLLAYSEREILPALLAATGTAIPVFSKLLDLLRPKAPAPVQ